MGITRLSRKSNDKRGALVAIFSSAPPTGTQRHAVRHRPDATVAMETVVCTGSLSFTHELDSTLFLWKTALFSLLMMHCFFAVSKGYGCLVLFGNQSVVCFEDCARGWIREGSVIPTLDPGCIWGGGGKLRT